jgi:hypothetical protein
MDMRSEIKKLARIEEGQYPFLSLYLNTKWDDEQQRERIRLFIKNQLKKGYDQFKDQEDRRKAFAEDQQRIEKYVEGLVRRVYKESHFKRKRWHGGFFKISLINTHLTSSLSPEGRGLCREPSAQAFD